MKAIALVSGGLDSRLATHLVKEQGIEIIVFNFKTPFCLCDKKNSSGCHSESLAVARSLALEFKIEHVTDEYFTIIKDPKHGYGANMNPCIDCRILLFKKAKELMQREGASFVITGEVLGQRPMSQHRQALKIIEQESGLEGLVLRPLSAKLLPETIPEKEGWVSREKLLNFSGRTRRPQMALAKNFEIKDYPCSAGGCLLTDPGFSQRMKDLLKYEELNLNNVELLKLGRHFRIAQNAKLIVGRDELENERLASLAKAGDYLFMPKDIAGPTALGRGVFNTDLIQLSCGITSRYCDLDGRTTADIVYKKIIDAGTVPEGDCPCIKALPIEERKLISLRI